MLKVKHLITTGIFGSCFVLFAAACATAFAIQKLSSASDSEIGLFRTCITVGSGPKTCMDTTSHNGNCPKRDSTLDAARAFYVMAALFGGMVSMYCLLRLFLPQIHDGLWKQVYMVAGCVVFLFSFLAWCLGFALFDGDFCGNKFSNSSSYKVGPSAPCMFVAWVCWGIGGATERFLQEEENSADNGSSALGSPRKQGNKDVEVM